MDIKDYIKELLLQNEGLIIPGFGGFVAEYEPALFDVNENKFLPPSKKLIFKPDYTFDDSVFAEFIENKEGVTIEEARKKIESLVTQFKNELKTTKQVIIPQVGKLKQVKGEILFEQDKSFNLLADSFGLKSLNIKPLSEKTTATPLKEKHGMSKKSAKKYIIIAASLTIFVVFILFSWFLTDGFSNFESFTSLFISDKVENKQETLTTKSVEYLDSIARADSIKANINKTIDVTTAKKEALFYNEQKEVTKEVKLAYSKFYIIAGSFKTLKNAEKFSKELLKKGFTPEIIESDPEHFRISIASYTSESEALKELYNFRANQEIKQVWILKTN